MSTRFARRVLITLFVGATAVEASDRFQLVVDPNGPTQFFDATGRHGIVLGGVADIDPGPSVVPGSILATSVLSPEGDNAALLMGGWLDITTANPSFASDFLFAADQDLTITFWFKSAGNGAYDPTPSLGRYSDRMHAIGFGSDTSNLDVDFGDEDAVAGLSETACWTYFTGSGSNNVVDPNAAHGRTYYLDDAWHRYTLVRASGQVTVYLDNHLLGTIAYAGALGSDSPAAHNYIGRASLLYVSSEDPFPWFGYIAGVRVFDEALPPDTTPPVLSCPPFVVVVDRFSGPSAPTGETVQYSVTATDDEDPAPVVVCMPPSGSFFPRGTTIVTCTATDVLGNQSVCTFPVAVLPKARERQL